MSEAKPTSFRVNEEDQEKFKKYIAEGEFNNQADAFKSLMNMVELDKAKTSLGDRGKAIEAFRDTANRLISLYLNALEENATCEEHLRDEISKDLKVKENTILNLMEQLDEAKASIETLKSGKEKSEELNTMLRGQLEKAENDNFTKQKNIEKLNSSNDLLQENLKEYKGFKDENKQLNDELKKKDIAYAELLENYRELENKNKQLEDKINNDTEIVEFYKNNNVELKETIKSDSERYQTNIANIKEEYKNKLEEELKNIKENYDNKFELEIEKRNFEIEKLNNTIKLLNTKKRETKKAAKNNHNS